MKKKIILFQLMITAITSAVYADVKLPSQCEVAMPQILYDGTILSSNIIDTLVNSAKYYNTNESSYNKRHWVVYSDRNNNNTYSMPSTASDVNTVLQFGEPLRVAKVENGLALVYSEPRVSTVYPLISSEAISKGWIPLNKLLLWSSALTNDIGVYRKTYLTSPLSQETTEEQTKEICFNPEQPTEFKTMTTSSEIFYTIKQGENGYCLVSNKPVITEANGLTSLCGWIKEEKLIQYDSRIYLEPNWDNAVVEKFAKAGEQAVFYSDLELSQMVETFSFGETKNEKNSDSYRISPQKPHYPILREGKNQYQLYSFKTNTTIIDATEIEGVVEARAAQKNALEKVGNLNLIIVIDGTKGMDKYFKATKTAINMAAVALKEKKNLQVGLVIYRDYADGDDGLVEYLPLLDYNDELLSDYFKDGGEYGIKSAATDKTNEDALFVGLEYALDKKAMFYDSVSNNLFIIVSNCGNSLTDTNSITQEDIIERMEENNIDIVSFQVRKNKGEAWTLFDTQIRDIYTNTVAERYVSMGDTLACIKDTTYGFDVVPSDSAYLYHMASYRYNDSGIDIDTTIYKAMMVERIMTYNDIIDRRKQALLKESALQSDTIRADSIYAVSVLGENNYNLMDLQSVSTSHTYHYLVNTPKSSADGNNYWTKVALLSYSEVISIIDKLMDIERSYTDRELLYNKIRELILPLLPEDERKSINNIRYQQALAMLQGLEPDLYALEGPELWQLTDFRYIPNEEYRRMETTFKAKLRNLRNIITGKNYPFSWINNGVEHYWLPLDQFVF